MQQRLVSSLGGCERRRAAVVRFVGSGLCQRGFSSSGLVSWERDDARRVGILKLNDPGKLNALTASMGDEFGRVVADIERDGAKGLGAVVLTGAGRAFSAGGDLEFLRERTRDTPSRNAVIMRRFYERFLSVRRIPVPVIAAINGPAIGAGLCVALACDIRIAAKDAKMGVTFTQLGLHPGMGSTYFLPQIVGPQQAARLLLCGSVITGEQAVKCGLVLECAESGEETLARALAIAGEMASAGPTAVRTCVRSLRMANDHGLDRALWREADAQSQCYITQDMREGISAVAEKRKANFQLWESLSDDT